MLNQRAIQTRPLESIAFSLKLPGGIYNLVDSMPWIEAVSFKPRGYLKFLESSLKLSKST